MRRRFVAKPGRPTTRHVVVDRCGVTGKVRYRTTGSAREALCLLRTKKDPRHRECRVYACGFCGGAHLTSQGTAA